MRDATQDIIAGLKNLLGNLYYEGTRFPVMETLPEALSYNHVWIRGISSESEGTKDKNIQRLTIDLEIIASGSAQRGYLTAINDISDQVLQLMNGLHVEGFFMVITPELVNYKYIEARELHENQTIIIDRKTITLETVIQEQWK